MNLLDAEVKELIGEPYEQYGCWWQKVRYDCWGKQGITDIIVIVDEDTIEFINHHNMLVELKIGVTILV